MKDSSDAAIDRFNLAVRQFNKDNDAYHKRREAFKKVISAAGAQDKRLQEIRRALGEPGEPGAN